jgi:hypothetical protein
MQDELMATLVSVYPFEINETKPGIYPGTFVILAAKDYPQSLIVGEAIHFIDRVDAVPLKIRLLPQELAAAVVDDWVNATLGTIVSEGIVPGFFWIPGAHKLDTILSKFVKEVEAARARQRAWFKNIVMIGDDDWSKYHKHTAISDVQRHAVKELGLEREWSIEVAELKNISCPACKSSVDSQAIICPNCKNILNAEKFKTLAFVGAK